jgi:hypothetical protein
MNPFKSASNSFSFPLFFELVEQLVKEGKTTGEQTVEHIDFTKLNLQRMNRWMKTYTVPEDLKLLLLSAPQQKWWLITEAWCGDSAQITVPLAKMAEASGGNIELKLVLRDENPTIMDLYLTNGGRAVPKLVSFDEEDNELFQWGPRPQYLMQMVKDWKANPGDKTFEDVKKDIHLWYAKDKAVQLSNEFAGLLKQIPVS